MQFDVQGVVDHLPISSLQRDCVYSARYPGLSRIRRFLVEQYRYCCPPTRLTAVGVLHDTHSCNQPCGAYDRQT